MTTRRRVLAAGAGALGVAAAGAWWTYREMPAAPKALPPPPPDPDFPNALRLPGADGMHGIFDATGEFTIVGAPIDYAIFPGKPARMLAYHVEHAGRYFINPLIRVRKGTSLRVHYWNSLDETSIVHWHGLIVDTNNDGHPHYAVGAAEIYHYHFHVANRAGTYWYHPHPHHLAAKQAYMGLTGFMIVEDDDDAAVGRALDLTLGTTDIPLLIQDKTFDENGALSYAPNAHQHFMGYLGDRALVNLTPAPCLDCATRAYRFRLVNGSNARIYRLAFTHNGLPLEFDVIGADGGLLERPVRARELFLAPAERADVVLDLRRASVGDRVMLTSQPFGEGAAAQAGLMLIRLTSNARYERAMPLTLSSIPAADASNTPTRKFAFDHANGRWRINGMSYRMTHTAFSVQRGAREIWQFHNAPGDVPHPVHVHGFQFRVLERANSPRDVHALAVDAGGRQATELGWKDSALLWPGETLKLLMDFTHPFAGDQIYMLQCHNLEHEAAGMMVNFRVAG